MKSHRFGKNPIILGLLMQAGACLPPALPALPDSDPEPGDAAAPDLAPTPTAPRILSLSVQGHDGSVHPLLESPRRPVLSVEVDGALEGDDEPVMLLSGSPDSALLDDAQRPPLSGARDSRRVPCEVHRSPGLVTLTPTLPLDAGAHYTILVAGWARGEGPSLAVPFAENLRVRSRDGGAVLEDTWPAAGTSGVSASLPFLALRFDESVRGFETGVTLVRSDEAVVPADLTHRSCEDLGWPPGDCVVVTPNSALAVGRRYALVLSAPLRDRFDGPLEVERVSFTTGTTEVPPIEFTSLACALDEIALDAGCVLADDGRIRLRLQASGPVRAFAQTGTVTAQAVAARGDLNLELAPLSPDMEHRVELRLVDLAGRSTNLLWALNTTPPLLPVSITEVRFDPKGPEPRQEYVEVINSAAVPIDLTAAMLSDRADRPGDVIAAPARIPAGARALIVADSFEPEHPADPTVPPGVVLIRVGSSLGSGGLSNSGEALYLRDELGRRLSAAPALPSAGAGRCLVRIGDDARTGAASAFVFSAAGECTPGSPDRPTTDGARSP